ncbi:MFS transporter [Nocardioidaceae bacterium SCSIO 66511]|nr:MFS transporter [Nocardioidaceae bacterium SCSIO 66511]
MTICSYSGGPVREVIPMATTTSTQTSRFVFLAMILAVSMTFIDQTIVAIASPELQADLSLSTQQGHWVINAYLVALAATFALGGRVADVLGSRRVVLVGIAGFAISSALCALTPNESWAEWWLVSARVAQGAFAAVLLPAAIAIVFASAAPERRGKSLATFFGLSGAFTALGPFLGGYLLEISWRAIFWINVPIAVVAFVLASVVGVADARRDERIDWRGAVLVAAGMALSVLGFSQSADWGWESPATWVAIAGGLVLLALFVVVERRTVIPLIRLDIFRSAGMRVDSLVLFFAMMAFVPVSYFLSIYADVSLGLNAHQSSILLLQFFLGYLIAAQVGGRIFDARGAKPAVVLGCVLAIAGFGWWADNVTTLTSHAQTYPMLLAGAGIGMLMGPVSADAVSRAAGASYGEVTGLNQTVRNYGASLGFAILGTLASHVFSDRFKSSLTGLGLSDSEASKVAKEAATGAGPESSSHGSESLRASIEHAAAHDFALGMRAVLIAMAIALAVALVAALRHPGDRPAVEAGVDGD